MNDEPDVRRLLEAAVRHEPPLALDRDAVLEAGRRRLRVRRAATVGGAAMAVVAVVLGMGALSGAQLGGPDEVGPAAPLPTATAPSPGAATTSPGPSAHPPATRAPVDLGSVLRRGPLAWPDGVGKDGQGREWYAFDEQGVAAFHLVAEDSSRRMVRVRVVSEPGARPECPPKTCESRVEDDGTQVFVTTTVVEPPGVAKAVAAYRPSGVRVQVEESTGVGPPWRAEPLLSDALLVSLATLPGFDVVKR